jgi:hypothetical protein
METQLQVVKSEFKFRLISEIMKVSAVGVRTLITDQSGLTGVP